MNKTSAVEWLKKQLEDYGSSSHLNLDWTTFDELCEQAKEMEKEQIIDAVNDSWNMAKHSNFADSQAEQYYNETYNKDK